MLAGCAVMNMDRYSGDGLFASYPMAKELHLNKYFTLPEIRRFYKCLRDWKFWNYRTFYWRMQHLFITQKRNLLKVVKVVVIVGAAEAILGPPAYNGLAMGAMATMR